MKLYLYMDEHHGYLYADQTGLHESDARLIPDRLGTELLALREREARVMAEINIHLHLTGQEPLT